MRALVVAGMLVSVVSLVACTVPNIVFTPDDAGADDVDSGDIDSGDVDSGEGGSTQASPGTTPGQNAMATSPEASAPPMPPTPPTCPAHAPMGAQGCCGPTPCVGPGCTKQCAACGPCAGQVCCVSTDQGGGDQKHTSVSISCAATPQGCSGGS